MQESLYLWLSSTHIAQCICRTVPQAPDINRPIASSWMASGCRIDCGSCNADNGYRVFPGGKAAGSWLWPPTPFSTEVKERVELYFYSTSGPSWPVIWGPLPLPLPSPLLLPLMLTEFHANSHWQRAPCGSRQRNRQLQRPNCRW